MITYCKDYLSINHNKINIDQGISCCLFLLIEKYEETFNYSSKKHFSGFLLRTLNYYLKDKNYQIKTEKDIFLNSEEITFNIFSKFIDILIHYSSLFLKHNKEEYAKLILSIGLGIINKSKYNSEKIIIRKKVSLANNIACTYLLANNFQKAEIFFDKCKENSKTLLDKIITYNNCALIQIKKIKISYNNKKNDEIISVIKNIKDYLKLMFEEINKRILNKYKISLNNIQKLNNNQINLNEITIKETNSNHKDEIFCFLIYNYFKMIKIFSLEQFNNNYFNAYSFIQKALGNHHFLSLKMIRLGYNINNSEALKSLYSNPQDISGISGELILEDSIISTRRNINEINQEKKKQINLEIKHEIKEEIMKNKKEEIKLEIKHEIKEEIMKNKKEEKKLEIKHEIKEEIIKNKKNKINYEIKQEIKEEIKQEKKENIKNEIEEEKKESKVEIKKDLQKEMNENITQETKKEVIKEEIINNNNVINNNNSEKKINEEKPPINIEKKEQNNDNLNNKNDDDKKKVPPFSVKKTWKGMFQALTGKKLPGTENKLGNLFKSIAKTNNSITNNIGNNIFGNKTNKEIKAQFNEYDEEMEKYLSETKTENYITFNKTYSNNYTNEFIICIIDENNEERKKFDRVAFEKSQQKESQKKPVSLFVTSYFKSLLQKKTIIHPELIEDMLDYDILEKMNNLYDNKRKNELYINKELDRITNFKIRNKRISIQNLNLSKIHNSNNNLENQNNILVHFDEDDDFSFDSPQITKSSKIETECYVDTDKYKISYINNYEDNKIAINTTKTKHSTTKKESFDSVNHFVGYKKQMSYNDIYYYYSKYYTKGFSSFCTNLRYINSINILIQRVLVQYIKLITINNEPKFVFCKYPKGNVQKLNRKGRPEFTFLNELCTFTISKHKEKTEIFIYNLNYTASLSILLSMDESSESVFFAPNKKVSNLSGKVMVDFEYNTNYKIFSKFSSLFVKLQKIFTFRDKTIKTFSEYAEKYKSNIHKISASDSMINIDLWIISLQEIEIEPEPQDIKNNNEKNKINIINNNSKKKNVEFQWNIELFSLTKIRIKNGAFYLNKNIILTSRDFVNILGCDYSDIYTIIDEKDN